MPRKRAALAEGFSTSREQTPIWPLLGVSPLVAGEVPALRKGLAAADKATNKRPGASMSAQVPVTVPTSRKSLCAIFTLKRLDAIMRPSVRVSITLLLEYSVAARKLAG